MLSEQNQGVQRAKRFSEMWREQGESWTYEQKDRVGVAYLRHVIGVDENTIKTFRGDIKSLKFNPDEEKVLKDSEDVTRRSLTIEQLKKLTASYLKNILGVSLREVQEYAREKFGQYSVSNAQNNIGMIQGGMSPHKSDCGSFWKEVQEIYPSYKYTHEDLDFLVEKGGSMAAYDFLWQLEQSGASNVLHELAVNAHAYK